MQVNCFPFPLLSHNSASTSVFRGAEALLVMALVLQNVKLKFVLNHPGKPTISVPLCLCLWVSEESRKYTYCANWNANLTVERLPIYHNNIHLPIYLRPPVLFAEQVCIPICLKPVLLIGVAPHQLPVTEMMNLFPLLLGCYAFLEPQLCLQCS